MKNSKIKQKRGIPTLNKAINRLDRRLRKRILHPYIQRAVERIVLDAFLRRVDKVKHTPEFKTFYKSVIGNDGKDHDEPTKDNS